MKMLFPIEQYVINFLKKNGGSAKYNEIPAPAPSQVQGGIFSQSDVQDVVCTLEEQGLILVAEGSLPSGRKNRYLGTVTLKEGGQQ